MKSRVIQILLAVCAFLVMSAFAVAQPIGADGIERGASERGSTASAVVQGAEGGNMTALNINGTSITERWQGFYGNVTGTITLDDAASNTLYDWANANPQGEIYAVNSSTVPTWADVICFNFSRTPAEQNVTLSELQESLNMSPGDSDTANVTFNLSLPGTLNVGDVPLTAADGCQAVGLFVNDEWQETDFIETIITDNSTSVIYTAILEQDATGFSGAPLDFQMIVGDNGDNDDPTDYYFYVELS